MKAATDISKDNLRIDEPAASYARGALVVGLVGLGACAALGATSGWAHVLKAYIVAYCFCLAIALGALFFVMLQHLTRAGWSVVVRRVAELLTAALPVLAVLAIPLVVFAGQLFPWVNPDPHDHLVEMKRAYLNLPFFVTRLVIYFAVWLSLAHYYFKRSVQQDLSGDPSLTTRMQALSAPGMVLFALTTTFAAFDLLMSLDPHYFSTIFGVYFFSGAVVSFGATLALLLIGIQAAGRMQTAVSIEHFHDIGKLVFAFTVFWAYIAFSQYMLIWYANLPEETFWFKARQSGDWTRLSIALLLGHFFVPFLALLSRHPKRRKGTLALGAVWVLLMHYLDMYWLVMPVAHGEHLGQLNFSLAHPAALLGIAGLCLFGVLRRAQGVSLVPQRDPRLAESLAFQNY